MTSTEQPWLLDFFQNFTPSTSPLLGIVDIQCPQQNSDLWISMDRTSTLMDTEQPSFMPTSCSIPAQLPSINLSNFSTAQDMNNYDSEGTEDLQGQSSRSMGTTPTLYQVVPASEALQYYRSTLCEPSTNQRMPNDLVPLTDSFFSGHVDTGYSFNTNLSTFSNTPCLDDMDWQQCEQASPVPILLPSQKFTLEPAFRPRTPPVPAETMAKIIRRRASLRAGSSLPSPTHQFSSIPTIAITLKQDDDDEKSVETNMDRYAQLTTPQPDQKSSHFAPATPVSPRHRSISSAPCNIDEEDDVEKFRERFTVDPVTFHPASQNGDKPAYSYATMIVQAIVTSSEGKLTLKEIYQWIRLAYPYYQAAPPAWQNSIRHNLSLHKFFVRVPRNYGKGAYWTVDPAMVNKLESKQVVPAGSTNRIQALYPNLLEEARIGNEPGRPKPRRNRSKLVFKTVTPDDLSAQQGPNIDFPWSTTHHGTHSSDFVQATSASLPFYPSSTPFFSGVDQTQFYQPECISPPFMQSFGAFDTSSFQPFVGSMQPSTDNSHEFTQYLSIPSEDNGYGFCLDGLQAPSTISPSSLIEEGGGLLGSRTNF